MAGRVDVVVIGAGHNGLTTAALLARDGRNVIVLEQRSVVGGLAAGEEFHPGYRHVGLFHDASTLRPHVVRTLGLESFGLVVRDGRSAVLSPDPDGSGIFLGDVARASALGVSEDAERYAAYRAFLDRVRPAVAASLDALPLALDDDSPRAMLGIVSRGLSFRRLGRRDAMELFRIAPMCVADWLGEWFQGARLKALLAGPALTGAWMGPWSPGSNALLLRHEALAGGHVPGGPAAVVAALTRACEAHGATIRRNAPVASIRVSNGSVEGVTLADGETIDAPVVASACDPKTTLRSLMPPRTVTPTLAGHVSHVRTNGTTAKVHLAVRGPVRFAGRPDEDVLFARTGASVDEIERAFDPVKYGEHPERPVLDVAVPTVDDPSLAPEGHAVVSALVHFVPHALCGGWTDARRERLGDCVVAELERVAPGVADRVVAREVLTPADIARTYGVTGGQIHHGEHAIDQLAVRPTLECARFATPISGLYLCGSGSHPGGGVTGGPGALAARVIAGRR